jgi:hypothetical protein
MAFHSGPPGVAAAQEQDWALVPYRQSTAATLEEARAIQEKAASQAQEPSPAATSLEMVYEMATSRPVSI